MSFSLFLPLISVPAVAVSLAGIWVIRGPRGMDVPNRWVIYLLVAANLMVLPIAIFADRVFTGAIVYTILLEIPALIGVFTLLVLHAHDFAAAWRAARELVLALCLVLVVLLGVAGTREPSLLLLLLIPPLLLAGLITLIRRMKPAGLGWLSLAAIAWLLLDAAGLLSSPAVYSVQWLRTAYQIIDVLVWIFAFGIAALLVAQGMELREGDASMRARWYFVLAGLLVLAAAANVFRDGLLVAATGHAAEDHLPIAIAGVGVVTGLVLIFTQRARYAGIGVVFLLLVPVVITIAYVMGGRVDAEAITIRRATRIHQALISYQADKGAYPTTLGGLTPRYLPFLLGPLNGRGQTWCYQGGQDFFRLGYAYHQRYYPLNFSNAEPFSEIRIFSSAGDLPAGPWMCDDALSLIEATGGL